MTLTGDTKFRPQRAALVAPGQIDSHVADMTATVAADVPLETVQKNLAKFDQWIPIDGDRRLSIGRLIETNSTGPLRLGYGAWRDLLLGCQFKTPGGQLITAGGRTMKNVAGYDLVKLMIGQCGMLGSLVSVRCRTYKRPAAALVAEFAPSDRWLGEVISTPLRPTYAILRPDALICGWLDDERAIALFETLATQHHPRRIQRRSLAQDIQHRARLWSVTGSHFRASVGSAKILRFVKNAKLLEWIADAGFGIVIGPFAQGNEGAIRSSAEELGGSATFFTEGEPPRWTRNPAESVILERLKKAFVPGG
ncbi:MAG TPA: FAD-binding oxidoreductase [Tepidisphaeraceae bacterium]|nr:FAD-binding oxidoreductase [Tepidisphaeraceae bacterium]